MEDIMEGRIRDYVYMIVKKEGLDIPLIKFKEVERNDYFGSCNKDRKPKNVSITFNRLIISDEFTFEYNESCWDTILHEIAHLKYPNHRKEFWSYFEELKEIYTEEEFWNFCFPKIVPIQNVS